MAYDWDFGAALYYWPAFLRGAWVSLQLAVGSSVLGTLLGVPISFLLRGPRSLAAPSAFLVDILRAIPNLVLIFFFYYFPYRQLLGIVPLSPFQAALWALVAAQAAYSADVFRAAVDQVSRNQILGVQALGFDQRQVWQHVIVPSLVRQTLPIHVAFWIGNLKLSSLASVIGAEEVVFVARLSMAQNFRSLEAWLIVAAIYVVMVLPLTYGLRRLEHSSWIQRQ